MQLRRMLDRCRHAEERAAALYRTLAARTRAEPDLCALWTRLAREEEEHAHGLRVAAARIDSPAGWQTRLDGFEEALGEVEGRLAAAEGLPPGATRNQQFAAALDLEMTELEVVRLALLAAAARPEAPEPHATHATHAADLAVRALELSDDPHVQLLASLALARARLKGAA